MGIPEAIVQLRRADDGSLIASGVTSPSGAYTISWTADTNGAAAGLGTANLEARLVVRYIHKDTAFRFRTFANVGSKKQYTGSGSVTLQHGTTVGSPQPLSMVWGSSATPSKVLNAYWAAYMTYRYVLRDLARFTNVDILAFEPVTLSANCPTSCAIAYPVNVSNSADRPAFADRMLTVVLDGSAETPFWPIERTMHELAHIGDFVSVPGGHFRSTAYDYNDPGNLSHAYTTEEYRPTALTEGLATFVGVASFFGDDATDPRTCSVNGNSAFVDDRHCYGGNLSIQRLEESHAGSCGAKEGRWPISASRFFWDIYDEAVDGADNIDLSDEDILTTMSTFPCSSYPACYGAGDLHNQFSSVSSANGGVGHWLSLSSTEMDDGNAWHWRAALMNSGGADVYNAFVRNCMGYW